MSINNIGKLWILCDQPHDLINYYFLFLDSDVDEIQHEAILNLSLFSRVFDLSLIQKSLLKRLINLFDLPHKKVFFKQKVVETLFGLTVYEDNEIVNPALTVFFNKNIAHPSIEIRTSLMFLIKDNMKLISPMHVLEAAYVTQINDIYDLCSIDQKLELIILIKLMIQNIEYLFHNQIFVKTLKEKFLMDSAYIVRMTTLKVFVEMKDFIGLKVFEKRLLVIFMEMGNSDDPDQQQMFCNFVIVF